MVEKITNRNSNFELMRIISMLMIIFWHIMIHGGVHIYDNGTLKIVLTFIQSFICIHVNSFILVTGYFHSESRFRLSKLIKLNNQVWFYKSTIFLVFLLIGFISLDCISLIKALSPITHYDYWFMSLYMFLYLLSPVLNIVINNLSKKNYKMLLLLLFSMFSILPFITNQSIYKNSIGYSLLQFVILYFFGAYFRKYKIEESYHFKIFSHNSQKLILLIIYFSLAIILSLSVVASTEFMRYGPITKYIGEIIYNMRDCYNNPFIMIESICYFLFFSLLNIKSKCINKISANTLGVYLIHDNSYIRTKIYSLLGFKCISYNTSIIIKMLLSTVIIFVICYLIECIRKIVFNFIYNRKISFKIRERFKEFIFSLGIKVRW